MMTGVKDFREGSMSVVGHTSAALEHTTAQISTNLQSQYERDHALLRAVEELKALVRQNNLLLQALTRRQQPVHELELSETFQFPMDTEEDLQRVENTLQDKTQEKALTTFLSSLGGCNPGDVVRRMLRHILTNRFSLCFNWLGRGGKKLSFAAYKICQVVRVAAATHKISASDCEATIKTWLKCSGDRSGGRKRRAERLHGGSPQHTGAPQQRRVPQLDTSSDDSDSSLE
ncbi:hypothetical protein ACEWY4_007979 [Coilia grayii]|uniref:DUF4806 domain-containing protein n=1 Tax=Coilia grayii TaxID=363190 RepID=A0ABD1K9K7_9TELE